MGCCCSRERDPKSFIYIAVPRNIADELYMKGINEYGSEHLCDRPPRPLLTCRMSSRGMHITVLSNVDKSLDDVKHLLKQSNLGSPFVVHLENSTVWQTAHHNVVKHNVLSGNKLETLQETVSSQLGHEGKEHTGRGRAYVPHVTTLFSKPGLVHPPHGNLCAMDTLVYRAQWTVTRLVIDDGADIRTITL